MAVRRRLRATLLLMPALSAWCGAAASESCEAALESSVSSSQTQRGAPVESQERIISTGQATPLQAKCQDARVECEGWAAQGECQANPAYMTQECALSCGACCADRLEICAQLVKDGHCARSRKTASALCAASCGACDGQLPACADDLPQCEHWAASGQCDGLEARCARSCGVCAAGGQHSATLPGRGVEVLQPAHAIVYGTAWKREHTAAQASRAYVLGYRAFDTATQPLHYNEAALGDALAQRGAALAGAECGASAVWVQSKFTPIEWQGGLAPYSATASLTQQVSESVNISLSNLRVPVLDALLLHGVPAEAARAFEAWRALESVHASGRAAALGVCNVESASQLSWLLSRARVRISLVQSPLRDSGVDMHVLSLCVGMGITPQLYRLTTPRLLQSDVAARLAVKYETSAVGVWIGALRTLGAQPLTGSETHMEDNLRAAMQLRVSPNDALALAEAA